MATRKHKAPAQSLLTPDPEIDPYLTDQVESLKEFNLQLAREDVNAFIEYVMVDEISGKNLQQAKLHETWQDLFQKHKLLCLWSAMEHGKSTQIEGTILFNLGKNPNMRIIVVSKNDAQAKKHVSNLERYIRYSERLHEVFPHLVPSESEEDPWNAFALTVQRPNKFIRDASVAAYGLKGTPIGSRAELVIFDDLLSIETVATPQLRDAVWEIVQNKFQSRMTKDARAIVIGTPYHPEDFLHRLAGKIGQARGWVTYKFPAIDPDTWDPATIAWPENWPLKRLRQKQSETDPAEFARQFLCEARDESAALFKKKDVDQALLEGADFIPVYSLDPMELPNGYMVICGVDLAVKKGDKNDKTVIYTLLVYEDGTKQLLWIEAGQWGPSEIIDRINDHHYRYFPIFYVENNQAQDYIVQWVRETHSPATVIPFTTGSNKMNPAYGVEGLAVDLRNNLWIIPSHPETPEHVRHEIESWIRQMLHYRRGAHTGDHLMACWFAWEGARRLRMADSHGGVSVRVLDGAPKPQLPATIDAESFEVEPQIVKQWDDFSVIVED